MYSFPNVLMTQLEEVVGNDQTEFVFVAVVVDGDDVAIDQPELATQGKCERHLVELREQGIRFFLMITRHENKVRRFSPVRAWWPAPTTYRAGDPPDTSGGRPKSKREMALDRDGSIHVEGVFRMMAYSPGPKAQGIAPTELPKYIMDGKHMSTEGVYEMLACNPGVVTLMQTAWVSSLLV